MNKSKLFAKRVEYSIPILTKVPVSTPTSPNDKAIDGIPDGNI